MAVFKAPLKREFNGDRKIQGKQYKHHLLQEQSSGRRRVFVQTETGCVLEMELDRSDNVHTVKKGFRLRLTSPPRKVL